ncbi:MAG: helix-turn-helix transcriptional regulator [Lachnospiraceae bacterium]|nr:helix-turn-helix transcriptional regulator [Lachnospiraceae bacterium]
MLSTNLKKIREEKGYSKTQLGKICDLHRQTIRHIEDGLQLPKMSTLEKISKALNVSIIDLLK